MSENPYDEKNVRSEPWRVRAVIRPRFGIPNLRTVTLSVSDGPEVYDDAGPDDDTLSEAVGNAATRMVAAALENEAGRWIEDHDRAYLVVGQTGEARWNVRAFLSEERAYDLLRTLNNWCCEVGVAAGCYEDPAKRRIIDPEGKVAKCPHDPGFRVDEAGVLYTIIEVPLDMFDPIGG